MISGSFRHITSHDENIEFGLPNIADAVYGSGIGKLWSNCLDLISIEAENDRSGGWFPTIDSHAISSP
jgi:hypothetical protein